MKKITGTIFSIFLIFSCQQQSNISKDFNCEKLSFSSLEEITDMKNLFSVKLPENWKTNLYFDDIQSSIYSADTTKQLTETAILDISFVQKSIVFDDNFKLNLERENLANHLIRTTSKEQKFNKNSSFYSISKGKKGNYNYQVLDFFIKVNDQNFLHTKTQIYGDSLVEERLCSSINLIEKITFK